MAAVELRRFLRDRSNIFFVFIFPLLLVLVIGSQFGTGDSNGRVAIAGADGELRTAIVDALESDDVEVTVGSEGESRERVSRGRADLALIVPEAASSSFRAGDDTELQVVVGTSPAAPATRQRLQTALRSVAAERGQVIALSAAVDGDRVTAALDAAASEVAAPRLRVVGANELAREFSGVTGFDVGASGQMLLFVFLISLAGSATLIQARRNGVMARALAAPVTSWQAIVGQALGRMTIAMFQGGYIMIATSVLFGVEWGNVALALVVLLAFSAVAAGAAMLIGSRIDNEGAASGVGVGVGLVLAAIGGCMLPLELFPDTLRTVAHLTPHAWAYEALADIQRHGAGIADVALQLAVLLAMAAGVLALGAVALRRSIARAM